MKALDDIAAERKRQVEVEGWTSEHDDNHGRGEMAQAAAAYAYYATTVENSQPAAETVFPPSWNDNRWNPSLDHRRNLVKAGAFIIAEIERLDRMSSEQPAVTLEQLLERVEKAEGPDWELDVLIDAIVKVGYEVREAVHPIFGRQLLARSPRSPHDEYWADHPENSIDRYTSSVDAILALIKRVLPELSAYQIYYDKDARRGMLFDVVPHGCDDEFYGQAPTLPLALTAAMLRTLIARGKVDAENR